MIFISLSCADTEGRFGQSSRNVGAGCDGRFEALSARACPARTNDALRTAKSCGPDAPGLASRSQVTSLRMTVTKMSWTPGRARSSRNTIAQGRPDVTADL